MGLDESRLHRESAFGPPSEEIPILDFIQNASTAEQFIRHDISEQWNTVDQTKKDRLSEELSLSDLKASAHSISSNSSNYDALRKIYDEYSVKHKENDPPSSALKDARITQVISEMGHSPLKHWPPPKGAIHYFRRNRRTELNSISQETTAAARDTMAATPEAIITISFYSQPIKISNRNEALVNGYVLDTICALEASQTLQTVFEQLPCADEDKSVEWTSVTSHKIKEPEEELYGMVLDHTAVGGGTGKWAHLFQQVCKASLREIQVASNTMRQTKLHDLGLKVKHPYWIYHKGNCIHCWLVEEIRGSDYIQTVVIVDVIQLPWSSTVILDWENPPQGFVENVGVQWAVTKLAIQ